MNSIESEPFTYRKLQEILSKLPDTRLDDQVTIQDTYGEFWSVFEARFADQDVLDKGCLYLSCYI